MSAPGRRCAAALAALLLGVVTACSASSPAPTTTSRGSSSRPSSQPSSLSPASGSTFSASTAPSPTPTPAAAAPAHVVIVLEENHSAGDLVGNPAAPYLNQLAADGLTMTDFYAVTHPSEPNYVALFSGSTQGLTSDACPNAFAGPDLGAELRAAHRTFIGYSEGLPAAGYTGCSAGSYARKHAPWTNFRDLPASTSQPLTAFPSDYRTLPTVSFVIPDLNHDMHDGTIGEADSWLRQHLGGYAQWARTHDSLLIVTCDEDDYSENNRIPLVAVGQHVPSRADGSHADLYTLLRTIESWYHLPVLGQSANRQPIAALWTTAK